MNAPQQVIVKEVPTRLDKILEYLSNAPAEVQIVAIIVFGALVLTFLKSDWSNFITDKLPKLTKKEGK